ncbi:gamma-glutamyl-gamma-aminobutyrate hydrolase family protein [Frondihabitans sucicola]|nr:gamma-glutamyl-gamma-aminobutyrate hydrolase family protein [Frondihabitans sucicola]
MTVPAAQRRLAVIEVTRFRPHAPEYHAYVDTLNARVQGLAEATGWEATRFAAADLGEASLLELTDDASAIALMGGEDLAPEWYGGSSGYRREGRHYEEADAGQLAVLQRALDRGTPVLGVCRGHQLINVALGGTLVQHLDGDTVHLNAGAPIDELMQGHAVALDDESRIATILGGSVGVRSAHHQAIDLLGSGLRVVGRASDGVVEAVEHATAPVTGVQWHPEDRKAPAGQLLRLLDGLADQVRLAA